MKQSRYYEIIDGMAYVYDQPYPRYALSVSIIKPSELAYYRNTFNLEKVWL